ncbi:MAG: CHAT domain-containing protein [Coleofasciculus sp. D1-CHI-01]|uniref:CHAT domain-containing protein n=1 Tax=Coleofasciculus sp. D1-CHI-01 TaxID=3068482 RepID=UPI0032F981EE
MINQTTPSTLLLITNIFLVQCGGSNSPVKNSVKSYGISFLPSCLLPPAFCLLALAGLSLSLPKIALSQSPPPSSLPHPDSLIANSTDDLAEANRLYQQVEQLYNQGKYNEAIPLAERMLRLYQSVHGEDHERQKRDYLQTMFWSTQFAPSFHLHSAPNNPQAAKLALTTIFRRKGRILDVSTNSLQRLRQNLTPENQALLDELSEAYSQLANLIYKTSDNDIVSASEDYRTQLASVEQRVQQLENQLSRQSEQFRLESKPVTIETIQPLIPDDAVLVELVRYKPYNPSDDSYDAPRYAAYILSSTGEPEAIDLGAADTIEKKITDFRQLFQNGTQLPIPLIKQSARALDQAIMAPIREKIGDSRHILIAPEGALSLIPFEALVDESNRYLVETYSFTYLTSGRDLLRLQNPSPSHDNPVLIADPYFQRPGEFVADIRFIDLAKKTFAPLPGTAEEAEAIGQLLNITPLMGEFATERAVKQVNSPSILHIATHGFFESNPQSEAGAGTINNNPLLLSGLILAGFRVGDSGGGGESGDEFMEGFGYGDEGFNGEILSEIKGKSGTK